MWSVAKSYLKKAFLILLYEEMRKYLVIAEEAVSHLCNRSLLDFLIYEENFVFFFISVQYSTPWFTKVVLGLSLYSEADSTASLRYHSGIFILFCFLKQL